MSFPPAESFFIVYFLPARIGLTCFPPESRRDCRMQDIPHLDARSIQALFGFNLKKKKKEIIKFLTGSPIILTMFLS